jgi:hypothetical protein
MEEYGQRNKACGAGRKSETGGRKRCCKIEDVN